MGIRTDNNFVRVVFLTVITSISLDNDINDIPTFPINRLRPLEIADNGEYVFISCTGGEWQDPSSGQYEEVNGQVHAWNISTLEKIATYEKKNEGTEAQVKNIMSASTLIFLVFHCLCQSLNVLYK